MKLALRALLLTGCSVAQATSAPPRTAPELRPPAGVSVLFKAHATGVQIYACKDEQWVLRAPEADLYDERGTKLGSHFGGPTWKAEDGSTVVGELRQRVPAPAKDAVPWLLLSAKKTEGKGVLAGVQWVQRVDTEGGQAPAAPCAPDQEVRIPYQANYYFWSAAAR